MLQLRAAQGSGVGCCSAGWQLAPGGAAETERVCEVSDSSATNPHDVTVKGRD